MAQERIKLYMEQRFGIDRKHKRRKRHREKALERGEEAYLLIDAHTICGRQRWETNLFHVVESECNQT